MCEQSQQSAATSSCDSAHSGMEIDTEVVPCVEPSSEVVSGEQTSEAVPVVRSVETEPSDSSLTTVTSASTSDQGDVPMEQD